MITAVEPNLVVREAEEWVDTPFRHQKGKKGTACDCNGLIVGVGLATGALDEKADSPEIRHEFGIYSQTPKPESIRRALGLFMVEIKKEEVLAGDILFVTFGRRIVSFLHLVPQHFCIVVAGSWTTPMYIVHAVGGAQRRVIKQNVNENWKQHVYRAYRYPGVDAWYKENK